MTILPQGKIAPATAGTPVALTAPSTGFPLVAAILIAQIAGTSGNVYFGLTSLNKTSRAGVIREFLPAGASGFLDSEVIGDPCGENKLDPTKYGVDADTNAQGMLVSYIQG